MSSEWDDIRLENVANFFFLYSLSFYGDIWMGGVKIWHKQYESTNPSCLVLTVQTAGSGVTVE